MTAQDLPLDPPPVIIFAWSPLTLSLLSRDSSSNSKGELQMGFERLITLLPLAYIIAWFYTLFTWVPAVTKAGRTP